VNLRHRCLTSSVCNGAQHRLFTAVCENEKQIVWGSIALALALYLVLIMAVLPSRTFFDSDPGVKFIQVDNLVAHNWREMWVDYRGEALDPSHEFSPFNTSFFYEDPRDRKIYGVYSVPFVVIAGFLYGQFGFYGLYLLPALSTLGIMWATCRLSKHFAIRSSHIKGIGTIHFAWLAPVLVGFVSPLLFYSVDFWEHTPAVLLSSLSIWWLLEGLASGHSLSDKKGSEAAEAIPSFPYKGDWNNSPWLIGAGLAAGCGAWFRAEVYLLIPACCLAFIWARRKRLRSLLAYGAGLALILLPIWFFQWRCFDNPLGPHLQNAIVPQVSGQVAERLSIHPLVFWALKLLAGSRMLLPWRTSTSWTVLAAGLVSVRVLAALVPAWRRALSFLLAIGMSLGVTWVVVRGVRGHWFARNVVQSFPLVLFLLFLGLTPSSRPNNNSPRASFPLRGLVLISVAFTILVCWVAPSTGGPQWGARFLLPIYPLLIVFLVYTLQRALAPSGQRLWWNRTLSVTFALLCLSSALTQFEGVRRLYRSKVDYEQLTQAVESLSPETVVTDIWWMPVMTATASERKVWFLVEHGRNGSLPDLISLLRRQGVTAFAYVTTPEELEASAAHLTAPHLTERVRHTEHIWLDVEFVTYALAED